MGMKTRLAAILLAVSISGGALGQSFDLGSLLLQGGMSFFTSWIKDKIWPKEEKKAESKTESLVDHVVQKSSATEQTAVIDSDAPIKTTNKLDARIVLTQADKATADGEQAQETPQK
jgi:hypothetical protein